MLFVNIVCPKSKNGKLMMCKNVVRQWFGAIWFCVFSFSVLAADANSATQKNKAPIGSMPGSFENLFDFRFGDVFWNNGKSFAALVKDQTKNKKYIKVKIYEGLPPVTQCMGDKLGAVEGGALDINQFARYVRFINENGNPGLAKNPIIPRVIVGVVTPLDISENRDFWYKRIEDAAGVAKAVSIKYAESNGAAVLEIVRVVASEKEMIYSEKLKRNVPLKNAFLITVANRYWTNSDFFATSYPDLEKGLGEIFTQNWHFLSNKEWLTADIQRLEQQLKRIEETQEFLNGLKQEDLYPAQRPR